jgi:hypothetical protein
VVAFDDDCFRLLINLKLKDMTVISLQEFETEELLNLKPIRNRAEYCWTCGPSVIYHCIKSFDLDHCTYLDSDLMFFSSPNVIFDEIGQSSIAITEHFTEEIDTLGGRYCVQFVFFRNDESGMEALTWWKDRCIDWCFARFEDGKYGDQKYLDYFPEKFYNVHVITNRGVGVAPWNVNQYNFPSLGVFEFNQKQFDVVFFHFHGTKIDLLEDKIILNTITYDLNIDLEENIYIPYLNIMSYVYSNYLSKKLFGYLILKRKWYLKYFSSLKKRLRNNHLVQFIYFKVFNVKYNGYEKNKI